VKLSGRQAGVDHIRQLRTENRWSQGELAERIGGDGGQISRYETANAAVLGKPPRPGRLRDPELAAHPLDVHATSEELLAFGDLADDLLGRVPSV